MNVHGQGNDEAILYRLKHMPGKEVPYAQLFRKYYKYFCRIAYRVVGDEYACEDIVQSMFIEFYEHRLYETVEVSIAACMEILLKNRCYDYLKSRSRNEDKIKNFQRFKNSVEVPNFDEQFQQRERIVLDSTATGQVLSFFQPPIIIFPATGWKSRTPQTEVWS